MMDGLLALMTASEDQLLQLPACFIVSGYFMRRGRQEPFGFFDLASLVLVVLFVGILVRRMYRSPVRSLAGRGKAYRLPANAVGPTASWAHFIWDGVWIWFGIGLWNATVAGPTGQVEEPGIGRGFVIVSSLLLILRILFRIRHRDSPENV